MPPFFAYEPMFLSNINRALVVVALAMAFPSTGLAQDRTLTSLVFRFTEAPTEQLEKALYENLRGLDPACSIHLDRSGARMDLLSTSTLPGSAFIEAVASIPGIQARQVEDRTERPAAVDGSQSVPGFPAYVETGDEPGDDLRYQEAKRAWIATHKEDHRSTARQQP